MRSWLLLLPALAAAADLKIDHATVAGRDVKAMQERLKAVGIPTVYGGPHANGVTEMALASFPDGSYLEAIAIQPGAKPEGVDRHEWGPFLKQDAIPCAWAIQSSDIDADRRRFKDAGVEVSAATRAGRRRPDGVQLQWATADLGGGVRGSLFPFLIQDFTPRDQRAFPEGKPVTTAFHGITRVVIVVRDLPAAVAKYQKAFGLPDPVRQADPVIGGQLAIWNGAPVVLVQPSQRSNWLDQRLQRFGEGPCAFVLGAAGQNRPPSVEKSHWSGKDVTWFDPGRLGWRLGYE